MVNFLRSIPCQCTSCGRLWRIPRRRIVRMERLMAVPPGKPFVWECHDCHEGVVVPGPYVNGHGETVRIDPKTLDSHTEVFRF